MCATDDGASINSTCFELFHKSWVSTRMLFGQKNEWSCDIQTECHDHIMQEELLEQGKTKSYFDDIIGKASGGGGDGELSHGDLYGLQGTWRRLLELAAKHGWKNWGRFCSIMSFISHVQ